MQIKRGPTARRWMAIVLAASGLGVLGVGRPAIAAAAPATTSRDRAFAPIDRPGPGLAVPIGRLRSALRCSGHVTGAHTEVPLFIPGTALSASEFSWNWFRALRMQKRPYCYVNIPGAETGDAQTSSEYIVYAIRQVAQRASHRIAVVGHSQGGLDARFALRFWPDTRGLVDDYIALAAPNHGSTLLRCEPKPGCIAGSWQGSRHSNFVAAVNSGQETFSGISYTDIYTHYDEYVQPNHNDHGTTSLRGDQGRITNVAVQQVCPTDFSAEHIAVGTYDPVAFALAEDALQHSGPARPSRVSPKVCSELFMPGVQVPLFDANLAQVNMQLIKNMSRSPLLRAEPALRSFVFR